MSTKITLSCDDSYHFFAECYDRQNVYLQLSNDLVSQVPNYSGTETRIKIPAEIFREMFAAWLEAGWTKEQEAELLSAYSWPGEDEG